MTHNSRASRFGGSTAALIKSKITAPTSLTLLVPFLGASAFLLFYNAFRISMPIASAGLYAQAARQIGESNFRLPNYIHFYGPGDVPFAYPPLAFYVMAAASRLGIPESTYLRFMPPVLTLLGLLVLYLLSERITRSRYSAVAAVAICAVSPALYGAHAWSSGAVRAMAFLFLLCGLYLFDRALSEGRILWTVLAGAFFGLVILTHLFYALFFALWLGCWVLANLNRKALMAGAVCVGAGVLISAPWVITMLIRYGAAPFSYAFLSHGNASVLAVLAQSDALPSWIMGHLGDVTSVAVEIPLVILGLVACLAAREFGLPLTFLASLLVLSPEGSRFVVVLAAILAGVGAVSIARWLPANRWSRAFGPVALCLVVLNAAVVGVPAIQGDLYRAPQDVIDLGEYVQQSTAAEARYLFLGEPRDGEWLPYLLQRAPFASKWGAEWLGTYDDEISLLSSIDYCRRTRVVECLFELHLPIRSGDVLVTWKEDRDVARGLKRQPACPELAEIGEYVVWKAACIQAASMPP